MLLALDVISHQLRESIHPLLSAMAITTGLPEQSPHGRWPQRFPFWGSGINQPIGVSHQDITWGELSAATGEASTRENSDR